MHRRRLAREPAHRYSIFPSRQPIRLPRPIALVVSLALRGISVALQPPTARPLALRRDASSARDDVLLCCGKVRDRYPDRRRARRRHRPRGSCDRPCARRTKARAPLVIGPPACRTRCTRSTHDRTFCRQHRNCCVISSVWPHLADHALHRSTACASWTTRATFCARRRSCSAPSELGLDVLRLQRRQRRPLTQALHTRAHTCQAGLSLHGRYRLGLAHEADHVGVDAARTARRLHARSSSRADGRKSTDPHAKPASRIRAWSYPQSALATKFRHARPHDDVSRPSSIARRAAHHRAAARVVVEPRLGRGPEEAARLKDLAPDRFAAELEQRLQGLARYDLAIGPRSVFPLSGLTADRLAYSRVALVGEAAPRAAADRRPRPEPRASRCRRAGRGGRRRQSGRADPGGDETLAEYATRARRADVFSRTMAVDLLNRSLISRISCRCTWLRGAGLHLLGAFPRVAAARHARRYAALVRRAAAHAAASDAIQCRRPPDRLRAPEALTDTVAVRQDVVGDESISPCRACSICSIAWNMLLLRTVVGLVRAMPLEMAATVSARLWRLIAPWQRRHRRALDNLAIAFPEKTPRERGSHRARHVGKPRSRHGRDDADRSADQGSRPHRHRQQGGLRPLQGQARPRHRRVAAHGQLGAGDLAADRRPAPIRPRSIATSKIPTSTAICAISGAISTPAACSAAARSKATPRKARRRPASSWISCARAGGWGSSATSTTSRGLAVPFFGTPATIGGHPGHDRAPRRRPHLDGALPAGRQGEPLQDRDQGAQGAAHRKTPATT